MRLRISIFPEAFQQNESYHLNFQPKVSVLLTNCLSSMSRCGNVTTRQNWEGVNTTSGLVKIRGSHRRFRHKRTIFVSRYLTGNYHPICSYYDFPLFVQFSSVTTVSSRLFFVSSSMRIKVWKEKRVQAENGLSICLGKFPAKTLDQEKEQDLILYSYSDPQNFSTTSDPPSFPLQLYSGASHFSFLLILRPVFILFQNPTLPRVQTLSPSVTYAR